MNRSYHIDLTTTANCNLNCIYCFEQEYFEHKQFKDYDLFISRAEELLRSDFFNKNYQTLTIGFWGGEPTLNMECIEYITYHFRDNNKVKFFIYSNGTLVDKILPLLEKYKHINIIDKNPKICIQVSYDGLPIHDIYRHDKKRNLTGSKIRNSIRTLWKNKIPSVVKSVITLETFKYLKEARNDILDLYREFPNNDFFRSEGYFPTIEYHNIGKYTLEQVDIYIEDLEKSLLDIVPQEVNFHKVNNRFFIKWLNGNRQLCSAGRDMSCLNWNGEFLKCHGVLYDVDYDKHIITTLKDDNFVDCLEKSFILHNNDFSFEPKECKDCTTDFCLKCNAVKYSSSNKIEYIDRWRDYICQPQLCKINKKIGDFNKALRNIIIGGK